MILLWGLPEAPNNISVTYISNTLSLLEHKIHKLKQFALQKRSAVEPFFLLASLKLVALDFIQ